MVILDRSKKDLVIPKSLGNFVTEGGSGGGITPEEAAEIASAVTEAAIDEYDTELQVELEELRDAISGNTDTLLDLAEIAAMSIADRVALFDEIFEKVSNGEKIYIKGLVQEETIRTAILPLVSYRPETNPVLHQGGNLYFAAKGDTDNVYFHIGLTSEGSIDPTSGNIIKRNIYNLPTASAEVKGGVRVGSGLTMTQDTLSVDTTGLVTDGDLAPFIVQQSANTENIATLSAATEAISDSLGNYATTAVTSELATAISGVSESLTNYATTATTDALSAVTSALTENLETLSGGTPTLYSAGTAYTWCVIYDYDTINSLSTDQKKEIFTEIRSYGGQGKFTYIRKLGESGRNQFFPQSKLTSTKAEYFSLGGENYDYVTLTSAGLFSNGYKAIYTLPTAAANKKGGVKVGSGLTMNGEVMSIKAGEGLAFSGNTLVVSGGGEEQNYVIVNSLSEITEPYAGLEAYRKEYTENIVYTGYTIDASQISEGFAAHIYRDGVNETRLYHNGDGFHWDWNNDADGVLISKDDYYYTINSERTIFTVLFNNPDAYVTFEEGVTTATTSTTISTFHKAVTYRYNGTAWEEYQPPKAYYLDTMSQADRAALYTEITQYKEETFPAGNYRFFVMNNDNDEYRGRFEVFVARFYEGIPVCFSGVMQSRYNNTMLQRGYSLYNTGEFYNEFGENNRLSFSVGSFNFSWVGDVVIDLDNNQIKRGEDVLSSGYKYDSFEDRDTIVGFIQNGGRYAREVGTLQLPQFKISMTSSGVSKTYYKPVLHYEDITPVTIDGEEFSTRFTFIYTKEDGSRFKFSFMTNGNQYGADFQYQALS